MACEHFIGDDTHRVDIACTRAFSQYLLGRHVRRRPNCFGCFDLTWDLRISDRSNAEIDKLDVFTRDAGSLQHNVFRLQIAMKDAFVVSCAERMTNLPNNIGHAIKIHTAGVDL